MENREAIEILKRNLACGENQCPFFVDCSECENRTENYELAEAIITAIAALEKQTKTCDGCMHLSEGYKFPCVSCIRNTNLIDRWEETE